MGLDATSRRRYATAIILSLALLMLVAGQTFLKGRLVNVGFLLYWLACFVLTALAMLLAFTDLREVQRRTRQEHRDLLETTLKEIEAKRKARSTGKVDQRHTR